MSPPARFAVVGGGIAGLAAALELAPHGHVTLFEPGRLGGKVLTEEFLGHRVDFGPDAFITRSPEALALCENLGLEVVSPCAGRALLWAGDRLLALPDGLLLGVPGRIAAIARSGLLSPAGVARAGLDLVLPRSRLSRDVSVRELVSCRFGGEVADRLVDPLVGGIHAGRTERLSAAATVPQLLEAARRSRSMMRALRSSNGSASARSGPVFAAPRAGLGGIAEAMIEALSDAQFVSEPASAVSELAHGVEVVAAGTAERFEGAVVAVAAAEASRLLGDEAPSGLGAVETASVVVAVLAYRSSELDTPAGASGFLVPRSSGRLMTACSFATSKWPHWSAPETALLRVSAGRDGDDRALALNDEKLVERLAGEVCTALGTRAVPFAWRVARWPAGFPQYRVGHLERVDEWEASLRRSCPRVVLAGSSYRGSGLPACIQSGQRAARALMERAGAVARA